MSDSTFQKEPGSDLRGPLRYSEYINAALDNKLLNQEHKTTAETASDENSENRQVHKTEKTNEAWKKEDYDPTSKLKKLWEETPTLASIRPLQKCLLLGANPLEIDASKRYSWAHDLLSHFLKNEDIEEHSNQLEDKKTAYDNAFNRLQGRNCEKLLYELIDLETMKIYYKIYKTASDIDKNFTTEWNSLKDQFEEIHSRPRLQVKLNEEMLEHDFEGNLRKLCADFLKELKKKNASINRDDHDACDVSLRNLCRDLIKDPGFFKLHHYGLQILYDFLDNSKAILEIRNNYVQDKKLEKELQFFDFLAVARDFWNKGHKNAAENCARPKKVFVVALDGGDTRGLVSSMILRFVAGYLFGSDEKMQGKFHWYMGTSTGALIALGLTKKNNSMTPSQLIEFYWSQKENVSQQAEIKFQSSEQNDNQFTQQTIIGSVPFLAYDAKSDLGYHKLHHNYENPPDEADGKVPNKELSKIVFPSEINEVQDEDGKNRIYLDGRLSANCPLNVLFKEIDQIFPDIEEQKKVIGGIISIGTGHNKRRARNTNNSFTSKKTKIDAKVEHSTKEDRLSLTCAEARCKAQSISLLRLSPEYVSARLDDVNEDNLIQMLWETLLYLCHKRSIREIEKFLVAYKTADGKYFLR